jgi:hypothetical protein
VGPVHKINKGGVSNCGLAIFIKKYLKAKEEEFYGNSNIFHHAKI